MGRPPKWETPEELEELIQDYFDSCFEPKYEKKNIVIDVDKDGKDISELQWTAILDYKEEQVYERTRPFTITGLAVALGTTRQRLIEYGKNDDFWDTIKKAKEIIHNWTEESLYDTSNGNAVGKIFNLKNNWGWVDKTEVDVRKKVTDISKEDVDEEVDSILGKNNLKQDDKLPGTKTDNNEN